MLRKAVPSFEGCRSGARLAPKDDRADSESQAGGYLAAREAQYLRATSLCSANVFFCKSGDCFVREVNRAHEVAERRFQRAFVLLASAPCAWVEVRACTGVVALVSSKNSSAAFKSAAYAEVSVALSFSFALAATIVTLVAWRPPMLPPWSKRGSRSAHLHVQGHGPGPHTQRPSRPVRPNHVAGRDERSQTKCPRAFGCDIPTSANIFFAPARTRRTLGCPPETRSRFFMSNISADDKNATIASWVELSDNRAKELAKSADRSVSKRLSPTPINSLLAESLVAAPALTRARCAPRSRSHLINRDVTVANAPVCPMRRPRALRRATM